MLYKSEYKGKGSISAKVVADSEFAGTRITTLELNYPRFIHSEFMTHRLFSRNASSSRAIPVKKTLKAIREGPAIPISWGSNKPGMQAGEEVDKDCLDTAGSVWCSAMGYAVERSSTLSEIGIHKQIANRITEPFQFIKVVVTATEWQNFFKLRLHEAAQPEIYELARCMFEAMERSEVRDLDFEEWHTPYYKNGVCVPMEFPDGVAISVAKCARVSYKNHDNTDTAKEADLKLAQSLFDMEHLSPFEHQASPMPMSPFWVDHRLNEMHFSRGVTHVDRKGDCWSGNFRNWIQYRQWMDYEG